LLIAGLRRRGKSKNSLHVLRASAPAKALPVCEGAAMPRTTNINTISLHAQRDLGMSRGSLATSVQRPPSSPRVDGAKDDAAGRAIAERMNTRVDGLDGVALDTANPMPQQVRRILRSRMRDRRGACPKAGSRGADTGHGRQRVAE
jgi:hypothetical protein